MNTKMLATILLLPVFAIPPGAADGPCDDLGPLPACAGAGAFTESECESYGSELECYDAEGEYATARTSTGLLFAEASAERAHVRDTFHAEAGACSSIDLVAESEYIAARGEASSLVFQYARAHGRHGNGTLVYEDPCGENLIPELEPGTYTFEMTSANGYAVLSIGAATIVTGTSASWSEVEDEDGETVLCERGAGVYFVLVAIAAPPVVLNQYVRPEC